jgi:hypothetical protein
VTAVTGALAPARNLAAALKFFLLAPNQDPDGV